MGSAVKGGARGTGDGAREGQGGRRVGRRSRGAGRVASHAPRVRVQNSEGAGAAVKREKRGERNRADMWTPQPHVIHISETTLQNNLMVKYERY